MILPTEKVKASRRNPKRLLIYGGPKSGKTTLASMIPDNLIIDLENGTDCIDAMKVNANSMAELQEIYGALYEAKEANGGKPPYKRITLDNLTVLEDWCVTSACDSYRETTIGKNFEGSNILELPMGGGYYWLRKEVLNWAIYYLEQFCEELILIGHTKEKSILKNGKEITVEDLQLAGKLASIVCGAMDATGQLYRDTQGRAIISFKHFENSAGARTKHLRGQDII